MKKVKCVLYGYTSYGYGMTGIKFDSLSKAHKVAKENIENGYWFSYKLQRI